MKYFLSCDWGTSSLRLYLVDAVSGRVIIKEHSDEGIARTFNLWGLTANSNPEGRTNFYLNILNHHIKSIELKLNETLKGVPLIISGMASSSIGFIELPYGEAPCSLASLSGFVIRNIAADDDFNHALLIVSGLKSADDVMRGEETQLLGCMDDTPFVKPQLFILPGTHSKHITVSGKQIIGFKTYMTGEIFELLSQKSILKTSVESKGGLNIPAFKQGVRAALHTNLLNALFKVRTNTLFDKLTAQENYSYLSGLLIGSELKDVKGSEADEINLLCGPELKDYYLYAFEELALPIKVNTFETAWMEEAVARGHFRIYKELYDGK